MDLRGSLLVILVIRGDFISGGSHGFAWIFYYANKILAILVIRGDFFDSRGSHGFAWIFYYANKILAIRGGYLCFDTLG